MSENLGELKMEHKPTGEFSRSFFEFSQTPTGVLQDYEPKFSRIE